jgi:RNA polymerase sigma-70 factor (ECF subfamily)
MTVSDASAIAASVSDPDAFVAIFERHYAAISRYLRRRLSRAIADELAAEVFATAFTRRAAYDVARPNALPWLYGIAANLLRSQARTEERALQTLARTGVDTFVDAEEPSDLCSSFVARAGTGPRSARSITGGSRRASPVCLG